jgi:hypothetical protein
MEVIKRIPKPDDLGVTELDIHLAVEIFFSEVFKSELRDVCGEEFEFLMILGFVVSVEEDAVDLKGVNYRFGEEEFGDFEVVDKEFVGLVVKGEVKVSHLVEGQILKTAATGYYNITHFRTGHKGSVIFVRWNTAQLRVDKVELILKQQFIED